MIDVTQLRRTSGNSIIPTTSIHKQTFYSRRTSSFVHLKRKTDLFDRVHFHFLKISIDEPILRIYIYMQRSCRWAIMWRNWGTGKREGKKKKGKKTNETKMESLLQITREMFRSFVFANGRQLWLFTWNWMKITPLLERCTIELNRRVSMAGEKGQRSMADLQRQGMKEKCCRRYENFSSYVHTVSVYT